MAVFWGFFATIKGNVLGGRQLEARDAGHTSVNNGCFLGFFRDTSGAAASPDLVTWSYYLVILGKIV